MAGVSIQRNIAASAEAVFAAISDFQNAPKRIKGIARVEMLTHGPVGKGTRFKETRVMFGREQTETMEVMEFTPPRGYVLGCENCGCRYRSELTVVPRGDGCEVTMSFEATPLTFFAKVMMFLMRPMMKMCIKAITNDLEDIKRSFEGGGNAAAGAQASPA